MAFDITADLGQLRRKKLFDGFGNFDMPDMGNLGQDDQQDNPYKDLFKANMPSSVSDVSRVSTQPDDPDDDFISRYVKARGQIQPETTATDRFNALLDKFPERQPPSIARRLVAMGAGFGKGGIDESRKIMEEPYMRDINAWKEQTTPQYNAANLERQSNVNERTLLGQMLSADTANRRTVSAEKKYRDEILSREKIAGDKNEIAKIRADAYAAKNAGWEIESKGARIIAVNPNTGERKDLGSTGLMDQRELEDLRGGYRVKAATELGKGRVANTQAGDWEYYQDKNGNMYRGNPSIDGYEPLNGAPAVPVGGLSKVGTQSQNTPGGRGGAGGGMLEQTRVEQDKMKDLYELDDTARKYITKNPNSGKFTLKNRPVVTPKGMPIFGASEVTQQDVDNWDAIKRAVDSNYSPPAPKPNTTSITVPPEQLGRTPAAGRGTQFQQSQQQQTSSKLYSPQEIQQMSPAEKRQRAIGFLIERNLPTDEQNIQHAIQTGRILRDQR